MNKSSSKANTILKLEKVTKTYNTSTIAFHAIKNICLEIKQGDFMAITGASGSGKSTLMHIIGLLDRPTSGKVILQNEDISTLNQTNLAQLRNQTLGFVFQQFNLLPKTSSLENVILPLLYSDIPQKDRANLGKTMLDKVGLTDKLKNFPSQLSGGQQQRVAIARALINNPKIILADEPTGNLDSKSGQAIMSLFQKLHQEGKTIVLVTHDSKIAKTAKKIITLKDGKIMSQKC